MKRIIALITALCLITACALCLGACSDNHNKEYPVQYGDVTIDTEPESIVVLSDVLADIISYIGYDIKMVGRSNECDQDFLRIVPAVGTPDNPSVDTIVDKGAELVLADSTLSDKSKTALEEKGAKVIIMDRANNTDELKELYANLGAVLGGNTTGRQKGEDAYRELFDMMNQFKSATSDVVKTLAYLYIDQNGQLCTFVKGSLEQKLFAYTGALNIFSNQEQSAVDSTQLRLGSPTYLFYDDESVLDYLRNDERLSRLEALTEERTYMIPLKDFYRQGTTYEQTVYNMIKFMNEQDKLSATESETDDTDDIESDTEAEPTEGTADETIADDTAPDDADVTDGADDET